MLPIYVISLQMAPERRAGIRVRLDDLGLKFSWVNGIDTRGPEPASGVAGTYRSHLLAYQHLLESEAECCLIFEDDSVPYPGIAGYLGSIERIAREIDLVFLEERFPNRPTLPVGPLGADRQVCLKRFADSGGCAYTINRRAAEMILKRHAAVKTQIDVMLHSWWRTGLLTAYVIPPLAEHGPEESLVGAGRDHVSHRIDHKIRRHLFFNRQRRRLTKAYLRACKQKGS